MSSLLCPSGRPFCLRGLVPHFVRYFPDRQKCHCRVPYPCHSFRARSQHSMSEAQCQPPTAGIIGELLTKLLANLISEL